MSKGYVNQLGPFHYRGHTVEAHVVKLTGGTEERSDPRRALPFWTASVDDRRYHLFPASPDDTEFQIGERIKHWIDEHFSNTNRSE
jgi:hypothetical protein